MYTGRNAKISSAITITETSLKYCKNHWKGDRNPNPQWMGEEPTVL